MLGLNPLHFQQMWISTGGFEPVHRPHEVHCIYTGFFPDAVTLDFHCCCLSLTHHVNVYKKVSKFKLQREQAPPRTQREDGKQDAHTQVASQAKAVPEAYGRDAERQEVRRYEQEFRADQQQVKMMTQDRRERYHQRVRV